MDGHTYKCQYCSIKFNFNDALLVHQEIHQEIREGAFPCSICKKLFYTSQNRDEHARCHSSVKGFQCTVCFKTFANLNYLKNHCFIHSKEKRHKCEFCPKQFHKKAFFKNHMRIHTGVKPFECEECKKKFNQRANLHSHIEIIHNDQRHQCTRCSEAFKSKRLLEYHIFLKHKNENPLKCTFCGKGYIYPNLLKSHNLICKSKPPTQEFFKMTSTNDYDVNTNGVDLVVHSPISTEETN